MLCSAACLAHSASPLCTLFAPLCSALRRFFVPAFRGKFVKTVGGFPQEVCKDLLELARRSLLEFAGPVDPRGLQESAVHPYVAKFITCRARGRQESMMFHKHPLQIFKVLP